MTRGRIPKPGCVVSLVYENNEKLVGTVLCWEVERQLILLQCKASNGKADLIDLNILKPAFVKEFEIQSDGTPLSMPDVSTDKIIQRLNKNRKLHREKIKLSRPEVSSIARDLIEELRKFFPDGVDFKDQSICIQRTIIDKPYMANCVRSVSTEKKAEDECAYITKLVERFHLQSTEEPSEA